ncbi:Lactamase B domain-containing protein [Citrus sinensis]|nr:Lactamase B domain-containing protein [Citrus sinensis]
MENHNSILAENGNGAVSEQGRSALIFLGTGCSSALPNTMCLLQPSDPPCQVCFPALSIPPNLNPNYRCNTSLLIDHCEGDGKHSYILIDVGKTFREQILRWFTFHKIPRVDSIILTHEHADAVLGLDDIRAVQPYSATNDIDPTPIFLSQFAMESISTKFPYLVQKKLKEGQEVRRVAQLDWKIIEEDCDKPFVASGLKFVPLPITSVWVFSLVKNVELHIYLMSHAFLQPQSMLFQKVGLDNWIFLSWIHYTRMAATILTSASLRLLKL